MHQKYMRLTKILLYIPLSLIIALGIPFVSSVMIEEVVIPEAMLYTKVIKILIFYLTQLSLGSIAYKLTTGKGLKELLNIQWLKLNSMGWVVTFTVIWLGLVLIFYWVVVRFVPEFHDYVRSWWVLSSRKVYEELLTTCLQAGFFEELFFRAMVSMILLEAFGRSFESLRKEARIVLVVIVVCCFQGPIFTIS